jgi:tetratricopeptide (TPR) repeat protein
LTTASDVYSLGVVLYELLAGRRPYRLKLESVAQLEQAILGADPAKPSVVVTPEAAQARATSARRLARELAGDLDTIVLKALHKAPAQRYATIAAFAGDLQRHQAGEPVHARPASWGYRARKFVARNRLAVGATAAVGAALIAATTVSLRQAQHARQQAARADEVKQYVLSIFADTDPFAGGSRNNTAVELLRQARDRLAAAPVTDAAIRVELLTSIGSGLVALGDVQQALPALDEATRLAVAHLKENDPNRLAAQLAQGSALVVTREARGAAPLIEAALDGMRRNHDTVGLIEALRWRSLERLGQSRFDESIADATEAVRLGEAQSTMTAKRALMQAYVRLTTAMMVAHRPGRLEPARRAYALALELHGAATHPQVLWTRVHYASALVDEGDPHSGLAELQAIAQPLIESAGQDHPYVGVLFWGIGKASLTLGDPLAAADAYRHALTGDLAVSGGRPSRRLALTHLRLASALLAARRLPEAQAEVRLANEVSVSAPWANEVSQRAKAISALLLQRSGHLAEADAVYTDLLALPHTEGPDEAPVIEVWLGALRSAQGRHAEALALLGTSVAFFSKKPKSIEYARTLVALGAAQLEDDRASEALQTLQQGDALLAKLQPNSSPERADVLVSLARAHLALGRVDEAVKASAAAAAFWIRYDPSLRETGIALLWHARALTAAGDAAKAAAAANQAGAILASVGAPDDRSLVEQAKRDLRAARR